MANTYERPEVQSYGSPTKLHADFGQAFLTASGTPEDQIHDLYWSSGQLFTDEEKREAFTKIATKSKEYSEALVERWTKEIDTYLVYAGLFSAILTAFNVESYQLLQPSPPDPSPAILERISIQLGSLSYVPPVINSAYPTSDPSGTSLAASSAVPHWAVWLNTLWFSSLIISLSSASVGILVKQWLNEFQSGLSRDSEQVALLRQHRLNNLKRCHVPSIVNAIPVLLQIALAFFLAGLLVLLWNLHRAVAAVTSFFVLVIAVFIIGTTIAPLMTAHCAWLYPQSSALYALRPYVTRFARKVLSAVKVWLFKILRLAGTTLGGFPHIATLQDEPTNTFNNRLPQQSWVAREHDIISGRSHELERDMMFTAYEATLDTDIIDSARARVVDWDAKDSLNWFGRLVKMDTFHCGTLREHFASDLGLRGALFYGYILLCATTDPSTAARVFTDLALTQDDLKERFFVYLHWLAYYEPPQATDAPAKWEVQAVWVLATHAALHAPEAERYIDDPLSFPLHTTPQPFKRPRRELFELNLMARIMDIEALPKSYNDILVSSMEAYASVSLRTLRVRESGYALADLPFERHGVDLRAYALLLYAVALRSRRSSQREELLSKGVKEALRSGLASTLHCLCRGGLDSAHGKIHMEKDIIRLISYIVRILSRELDSFVPLLSEDFCVHLEKFLFAFKHSALFSYHNWMEVPWKKGRWTPSDLCDTTQALITRLRDLACRAQGTPANQTVPTQLQPQGNTVARASTSSAPRQNEEASRPLDSDTVTVRTPPSTSHPGAPHVHSSKVPDLWMWMYHSDDFPEL